MKIGELARRASTTVRAIRYYEEQGLLESERSTSGQRLYTDDAVWRVQTIQALYSAGLSSRAIRDLGPCVAPQTVTAEQVDALKEELRKIDEKRAELQATRTRLAALLDATDRPDRRPWSTSILPGPSKTDLTLPLA